MSSVKPLIALNFKVYKESLGPEGLRLCEIASEVSLMSGVRIIVCPQTVDLMGASKVCENVYGQHTDANEVGAFTGSNTAEALKSSGCVGSLVNHAEKKIPHEKVRGAVARLTALGLESMVCTANIQESVDLATCKPSFLAVEPPELIGSGISVSSAKPEIVTGTVDAVHKVAPDVPVICGAGISTPVDIKKACELGAVGVLLASAYVKSKDPKKLLSDMAAAVPL